MSYDRNNISKTTENGINDLVKDIIGGHVSIEAAFTEIKFKPLQKKILKAIEIKDDEDWETACTENTAESYTDYLSSYDKEKPWYTGKHVADAKAIFGSLTKSLEDIDDEVWQETVAEGSIESFQSYLSAYDKTDPDYSGKHVEEAKSGINAIVFKEQEEKDWKTALGQNSEVGYTAYISMYDKEGTDYSSSHVTEAREALDLLIKLRRKEELSEKERAECQAEWTNAVSENTILAYQNFIDRFKTSSDETVQRQVREAKDKILSIHNDKDWQIALKTNFKKWYDKCFTKFESLRSEYQGKYLDKARSWFFSKPNPKYKIIKIAGWSIILLGLILFFGWLWKPTRNPLTEEEINTILVQYVDSLRQDLFDGFYLVPISKADVEPVAKGMSQSSLISVETTERGLYSRDDVIKKYMLGNGKFIVKNNEGETIILPEASNGIDSICVKDSPFLEYIDNNGLRRVVVLYNGGLYYYLGECGTVDNIRQFILVNQEGKYGILNINKIENKRFENEKIVQLSSSCRYYILNNGVKTEYENGHEYIPTSSSTSDTVVSTSNPPSNQLSYFYDSSCGLYGYKDLDDRVVIKPQYLNASSFNGNYAKVKGPSGYGLINKSNVKCVPLQYKYLDLSGSTVIAKNANDLYGLVNVSGKVLIPFVYKSMSRCGNYIEVTAPSGKEGLFDANGNRILNDIYDDISAFSISNGLIPCKLDGYWGYMTTSGNKSIDFKYKNAGEFTSFGLAVVKDSITNLYGYIDKSGDYVIKPSFYSAGSIDENGAQISNSNGLKARINKKGNILTQFYKEIGSQFYCERIWVALDTLIGFSDNQKHLVIPFMFDYPEKNQSKPSFDGYTHLCKISYNGVEWYINVNGAFAYPANGNPTEQNITQQIREAKAEVERRKKGVERQKKEVERPVK